MISAKKQRKTTEWERRKISSRKLDTKGTFHAKMASIKDRNGIDLKEAEDIKKRWLLKFWLQNCTEMIFTTQIIMKV